MKLPDKSVRPPAFDYSPYRYQWRIGRAPSKIVYEGEELSSNPLKETAIFVVHGIGDQRDTDTAVSMRWGIEDALPLIELGNWDSSGKNQWILPAPYINDGHWAQYDDLTTFKEDIGDDLDILTKRQLEFFTNAWRSRTLGWFRSWIWIVKQGLKLIVRGNWYKSPFFLLLTILTGTIMFVALVWPRSRKFVVTYANDARLYMEPNGDLEHEIVQLIDRRVARGFLNTIGLDMDFNELPKHKGVLVGGEPYHFRRVVWTAHSLGTVISFNVLGDILDHCLELRKSFADKNKQEVWDPYPKVERVECSIANFVTFGSPIDKVCFLYGSDKSKKESDDDKKTSWQNSVLRKWPAIYLPGGKLDITKNSRTGPWWINVFYGSDPISGPLNTVEEFLDVNKRGWFRKKRTFVQNISTFGIRLPLASHTSYWKDSGLVTTILSATFDGFTKDVKYGFFNKFKKSDSTYFFRSWPDWTHGLLSSFGLFWITIGLTYLLVWSALNWQQILQWYQTITGAGGG